MFFRFFLIILFLIPTGFCFAQTSSSTGGSGPTAQVDQKTVNNTSVGIQNGITQLVADNAQSWFSQGCDYISNICVFLLFKFYDKFVGKFLLSLPDMSNPNTYNFIGGTTGNSAVQIITSITQIFSALGLYLFAVFFTAYVATSSSGFSSTPLRPEGVLRLPITMILLFAWPVIFSVLSNTFAALTDIIYSQNSLSTTGVFVGLQSLSFTELNGTNANQVANNYGGSNAHTVFVNNSQIVWNVVYFFAIAFIALGVLYGASMFSGGKQEGKSRILMSIVGLLVILSVPTLVYFMINKGVSTLGSPNAGESSTINAQNVISSPGLTAGVGTQFQQGPGITTTIPEGTTSSITSTLTAAFTQNAEIVGAAILKIIVSISGVIIVMLVIMAKFLQILSLFFIFLFGPVFIGFLGHPSTQHIATKAGWLLFKTLIYNPIWAILLIGLYIVPNINFGMGGLGINSILTAFAVLTALKMIQNASEWVGMFTIDKGLSFSGSKWNEPLQQVATMAGGVASFAAAATGPTGQALATAAASGLGGAFGGPAGAAALGGKAMGMMNTANLLSSSAAKITGGNLDKTSNNNLTNFINSSAGGFLHSQVTPDPTVRLAQMMGAPASPMAQYAMKLQGINPNPDKDV